MNLDIVIVFWDDSAHLHFGWSSLENIEDSFQDEITCVSVGIVLQETDDYIVLAQSSDKEKTAVSNSLKIPKKAIKEINTLHTKKGTKR